MATVNTAVAGDAGGSTAAGCDMAAASAGRDSVLPGDQEQWVDVAAVGGTQTGAPWRPHRLLVPVAAEVDGAMHGLEGCAAAASLAGSQQDQQQQQQQHAPGGSEAPVLPLLLH